MILTALMFLLTVNLLNTAYAGKIPENEIKEDMQGKVEDGPLKTNAWPWGDALNKKLDAIANNISRAEKKMEQQLVEINRKFDHLGDANTWVLQQHNVCFGAKRNTPGNLSLSQDGALYTLKLVYKSGYVNCDHHYPAWRSHWGCGQPSLAKGIGIAVTDDANTIVFPQRVKYLQKQSNPKSFYLLPGFNSMSEEIVFMDWLTPMYTRKGRPLRLWYLGCLKAGSVDDNEGVVCADVYAKFV